ncbi:MAG TPA: serine/threonine-protein kinase [Candidatus Ratteibacteria bacterium]|jgi:serine/threonine-protein kinase|uniref:Serine/threonine-protein kinase PrkC n=1 Tax=candidate division TA06 bacterium ADurb.Bin131 TaxID=1852827 RepID=A0A1V6CC16_UNCT6|nr:MAG: Serine/threonine-protein kinase PrkC [candidate division TA06 bacterium ADurb.Bin131]HOC01887.1 serine/threonine-protein kinase [bacterium]HON05057.1 serine/threonine-protein kinase [bacterium]HRS05878.1 serine/threonine-protein kinase [Candidatus Ratteibacteria bacterium]HRV03918.1 serine/threonine-protein kinase [Candidatus Ratteibacteria bacterium]
MVSKRAGQIIEGYEIVEQIWQGSTSGVYLAKATTYDSEYGPYVAIKFLNIKHSRFNNSAHIKQFKKQAEIMMELNHPNIVKVYKLFQDPEDIGIFMEYVPGKSMRQWSMEKTFSLEEVLTIFKAMLLALDHLEQHKIIHKDIKPENILISPDLQQIKLTDFGYAIKKTFLQRDRFPYAGTERYMAPERRTGITTHKSDIYSVGKIVEEFLNKCNCEIPGYVTAILKNCIDPDPANRYEHASLVYKDLEFLTEYHRKKDAIRNSF